MSGRKPPAVRFEDVRFLCGVVFFGTITKTQFLQHEENVVHVVQVHQVDSFKNMKDGEMKENFRKARDERPMKYGDCVFYRDITFHHGSENKSNITRKYLHMFLAAPTTRWVDFFEVKKKGVFMVNSFQEMMGLSRVLKSIR